MYIDIKYLNLISHRLQRFKKSSKTVSGHQGLNEIYRHPTGMFNGIEHFIADPR